MIHQGLRFRTRLILIQLIMMVLIVFLLSGWWFRTEEQRIIGEIRAYLSRSVLLIQERFESVLSEKGWSTEVLQELAIIAGNRSQLRITIIDNKGKVWADSQYNPIKMENHLYRSEIQQVLNGEVEAESLRFSDTLNKSLWYKAVPLKVDQNVVGVIRVAKPEMDIEESLSRIRITFYSSFSVIIWLALGVGVTIIIRVTRPLLELEQLAQSYTKEDNLKPTNDYEDEFAKLGSTIKEMAQRLSMALDETREEKTKLQSILENMDDGLLVFNDKMRLEVLNRAAERLLGLKRSKVLGRTVPELLVHPDLEAWMLEANTRHIAVSGEFQTRIPFVRNIHALAAPIEAEFELNESPGTIVLLRDLTRLRRLEQVRQDFVANVSHELRTPVTAVRVMAETLAESDDIQDETRHFLQGILLESERMARIVNDLLILAQLDEGKGFADDYYPFSLNELVDDVVGQFSSRSKHVFQVKLPSDLPLIAAQSERIRQVISNLLENAQKYTPEDGVITVRAQIDDDKVKVTIEDTGPGVPQAEQERIFERFYRTDKARSRAMGGTGLGLSIVKRIVEGYKGEIWVESEEGKGAVFHFTLPHV